MSTAGALYLARERELLVRDDTTVVKTAELELEIEPTRWPISECMSDRAAVQWWLVLREFGLTR